MGSTAINLVNAKVVGQPLFLPASVEDEHPAICVVNVNMLVFNNDSQPFVVMFHNGLAIKAAFFLASGIEFNCVCSVHSITGPVPDEKGGFLTDSGGKRVLVKKVRLICRGDFSISRIPNHIIEEKLSWWEMIKTIFNKEKRQDICFVKLIEAFGREVKRLYG